MAFDILQCWNDFLLQKSDCCQQVKYKEEVTTTMENVDNKTNLQYKKVVVLKFKLVWKSFPIQVVEPILNSKYLLKCKFYQILSISEHPYRDRLSVDQCL